MCVYLLLFLLTCNCDQTRPSSVSLTKLYDQLFCSRGANLKKTCSRSNKPTAAINYCNGIDCDWRIFFSMSRSNLANTAPPQHFHISCHQRKSVGTCVCIFFVLEEIICKQHNYDNNNLSRNVIDK